MKTILRIPYVLILFTLMSLTSFGQSWEIVTIMNSSAVVVPADTVPSQFTFTDIVDVDTSIVDTSDGIVLADFDSAYVTISGGTYRIGVLGTFISTTSIANNGDTIWVKNTSSASYSTAVHTVLTVGGVLDTCTITTMADPIIALLADGNTVGQYAMATLTKNANNKVTSWTDLSDSSHHLLQADTSKSPTWSSDGVTFDGVNDKLVAVNFTYNQPTTMYAVFKIVTVASGRLLWDGSAVYTMALRQVVSGGDSTVYSRAGVDNFAGMKTKIHTNTYGVLAVTYNGASSIIQLNDSTASSGDIGTNNPGGFMLGDTPDNNPSNAAFKEVILRKGADSEANRTIIKNYLNSKYTVY